jgi:hypothetical protein
MRKRLRKKLGLKEFTDYVFYIYIILKDEYNDKENCKIVLEYLITICERYGLLTSGMSSVRKHDHQLHNIEHYIVSNKGYYVMHCRRGLLCMKLRQMEVVKSVICGEITKVGRKPFMIPEKAYKSGI